MNKPNRMFSDYNPDILETIANLSNDEVFTPPDLARDMLDMLPKEVWSNSSLKFLDPAVKTGIFLREITSRLIDGLADEIPDLQERVNHILTKQVYGLGITELTTLMSRRTVYCSTTANGKYSICTEFDNEKGNILFPDTKHTFDSNGRCEFCGANKDNYSKKDGSENYAYPFIHDNFEEVFDNMKFDVIIGNPPYHMGSGSKSISLYDKFVFKAKEMNPKYISMIIPARWYTGGKGLAGFRENMLNSNSMKEIHDYVNPDDCFESVGISGGVCYFLIDKDYKGKTLVINKYGGKTISSSKRYLKEPDFEVFIRDNIGVEIHKKVKRLKEDTFNSIVSVQTPFGITSSFEDYKEEYKDGLVEIYLRGQNKGYIERSSIPRNTNLINKHKVFVSKSYSISEAYQQNMLNKPFTGGDNSCCSQTYLLIGPFNTEEESENVNYYMQTKFFRFMLSILKNSQDNMRDTFMAVPMQDFSKKWTDKDLYDKYKLSEDEVNYIESKITERLESSIT